MTTAHDATVALLVDTFDADVISDRVNALAHATLGWRLHHDPAVRARRRELGLSVPDDQGHV